VAVVQCFIATLRRVGLQVLVDSSGGRSAVYHCRAPSSGLQNFIEKKRKKKKGRARNARVVFRGAIELFPSGDWSPWAGDIASLSIFVFFACWFDHDVSCGGACIII